MTGFHKTMSMETIGNITHGLLVIGSLFLFMVMCKWEVSRRINDAIQKSKTMNDKPITDQEETLVTMRKVWECFALYFRSSEATAEEYECMERVHEWLTKHDTDFNKPKQIDGEMI